MLLYQKTLLPERVNTFLGSLLLATVAFYAALTIWEAGTGKNLLVQAFAAIIEQQVSLSPQ